MADSRHAASGRQLETADLREHLTGTTNSQVRMVGILADQRSGIFAQNHRMGTFARTMDTKSPYPSWFVVTPAAAVLVAGS